MKKIKIVFLQYQLVCGGAEQALYDLIGLMDKSRFDITVVALVDGGEWEDKFRDAGIPVKTIFYKRDREDKNPIHFLHHQLRKLKLRWWMKFSPQKLLPHLVDDSIDIVVSYSFSGFERIVMVDNAKYVKYVHFNVASNVQQRMVFQKYKDILSEYHKIVCVSDRACEAFKQILGFHETVERHYNPINSDHVLQLSEQSVVLPQDVPYICAVGRLAPEKAYDRLIRVHRRILDQGIAHKLIIVGDGSEKEHLLDTIRETGTSETVTLAGYQSNPYPYMKHSRFLVCSSYTEGLPVIAMEALTLGVPIVSAVPSVGELFGEECCGILTENDDDSLEAGIRKMLEDGAFYEKAKQGAESRSVFFDGKNMVKEVEDMFMELMEGNENGVG